MGKYNGEYKISNHAYMELYHFCMRYDEFKNKEEKNCELIRETALETDKYIYEPLLENLIAGITYDQMIARGIKILCGRRQFYNKRYKFFYLLLQKKG